MTTTRLEAALTIHFKDKAKEAKYFVKMRSQTNTGVYNRLFDNIDIFEEKSSQSLSEEMAPLVNKVYHRAVETVPGFVKIARFPNHQYLSLLEKYMRSDDEKRAKCYSTFPERIAKFFEDALAEESL